jgi:hypothetical protein
MLDWFTASLLMGLGALVVGVLKVSATTVVLGFSGVWRQGDLLIPCLAQYPLTAVPDAASLAAIRPVALWSWGCFLPSGANVLVWPGSSSHWAFLGLAMGFRQVMRGAHFSSHNLWAGWWVWFSQVMAYGLVSAWFAKKW